MEKGRVVVVGDRRRSVERKRDRPLGTPAREEPCFGERQDEVCQRPSVGQGEWAIARDGVLRTLLGSCVAVCLFDPVARILCARPET